ncbi:MAG TPA: hypothetical protein DIC64_03975 [Alphaproteobacteria bacterium]|nr:hypothetical protein [Alphaproteobacteria bacterium]
MDNQEDISTEEILASIRSILLEKQEIASKEEVFELTKEMIHKSSLELDYNKVVDEVLKEYAAIFEAEEAEAKKQEVRVPEKTDL